MKSYKFFITSIYCITIFLHSQDIQENGIEFNCDTIENETGYYWPKIDSNDSFAYIDTILFSNIIESKDKIKNKISDYLGHFIDKQSEKIYLYGQIDETSQTEDDDDFYDDKESQEQDNN